jgi:hypothetical protein
LRLSARLGGGRNLGLAVLGARAAGAAARPRLLFGPAFLRIRLSADGGRQDVERNAFASLAVILLVASITIVAVILTLGALGAFVAVARPAALWRLGGFAIIVAIRIGFGHFDAVVLIAIAFAVFVTAAALLVEADAAVAEDAVIMIGELQIIFGLDAVARELRIPCHALVFLEQLGGIAALPVVLAIAAATTGHSLWALPTAAPTTAALTIVDQVSVSLSHWHPFKRRKTFH